MLFPGFGSVKPSGGVTVAVFTSVPVASGSIVPLTVNVAVPPARRFTSTPEMFPTPSNGPLEPTLYDTVQVGFSKATGNVSLMIAPTTSLGPGFVTRIVYVSGVPGIALTFPSVFRIERSPVGSSWVLSVAVLFAGFRSVKFAGGVTVTVLTSVPVAEALIVPFTVKVMVAFFGKVTTAFRLPIPLAGPVAPPAYVAAQVTPTMSVGMRSATTALVAVLGPVFVTTIV